MTLDTHPILHGISFNVKNTTLTIINAETPLFPLITDKELHYFGVRGKNMTDAIKKFYSKEKSVDGFIQMFTNFSKYHKDENQTRNVAFFEKTHSNIMYPHIAYIYYTIR